MNRKVEQIQVFPLRTSLSSSTRSEYGDQKSEKIGMAPVAVVTTGSLQPIAHRLVWDRHDRFNSYSLLVRIHALNIDLISSLLRAVQSFLATLRVGNVTLMKYWLSMDMTGI
jgi:hypothetical protein